MKLNYDVNVNEINVSLYKKTKLQQIVNEFAESGKKIVKIDLEPGEYKSASSAASSLYRACKRFHVGIGIDKGKFDAELLKRNGKKIESAAVDLGRTNYMVASVAEVEN